MNLEEKAREGIDALSRLDEAELYKELGARMRAIALHPEQSGQFDFKIADAYETLGPIEDLREIGRRYFAKVEAEAYALMCGSTDEATRERVLRSFGLGADAVAAAIAATLVAQAAMAPAAAAVVATLAIRIFFRPAYAAMCEVWSESLAGRKPA